MMPRTDYRWKRNQGIPGPSTYRIVSGNGSALKVAAYKAMASDEEATAWFKESKEPGRVQCFVPGGQWRNLEKGFSPSWLSNHPSTAHWLKGK